MTVSQAFAKPSNEDVAGALVLLGVAALAHHQHHYREGQSPSGAENTAMFERGYRDGLHGYTDDLSRTSPDYAHGYEAGTTERANRNRHRTNTESSASKVPHFATQACAALVAKNFGVGTHDVHITRTVYRGENDFLVEGAVGHGYMTCVVDGNAEVLEAYGGPIQ